MRYFKTKHSPDALHRECRWCGEQWTCPGYFEDLDAYEEAAEREGERRREEKLFDDRERDL